jgi:Methyltransferase domain
MNHFYHTIQGWFNYAHIYKKVVEDLPSPAHIVEVGAWKGKSTSFMCVEIINSGKLIQFDVVDTWLGSPEHQKGGDCEDPYILNNSLYEHFIDNMKPVAGYYNPRRMTSLEAAETYQDESLDFVLIDAGHEYQSVRADILAWLPKIRPGGILAGDDYPWLGVQQAVDELFPNTPITNGCWAVKKLLGK